MSSPAPLAFGSLRAGVAGLLSRRGFLRLAGAAGAFTALAQLRVLPPVARGAEGEPPANPFDPMETEILTQIVERMVETGEPTAPRVRDTAAVSTIAALCQRQGPDVVGQLSLALRLFEYGPILFDLTFARFSRMTPEERDASLECWMTSRLTIRRLAFLALRNLSMLGYWSQPETWPLIGYQGPLLPARGRA
jgi:hypothetical protein